MKVQRRLFSDDGSEDGAFWEDAGPAAAAMRIGGSGGCRDASDDVASASPFFSDQQSHQQRARKKQKALGVLGPRTEVWPSEPPLLPAADLTAAAKATAAGGGDASSNAAATTTTNNNDFSVSSTLADRSTARVRARAETASPPAVVFDLLADPMKHALIFGSIERSEARLLWRSDDDARAAWEVDYLARWSFWNVKGTCVNRLYMDTDRAQGTVSFRLREPGFLKRYEGTWRIAPGGGGGGGGAGGIGGGGGGNNSSSASLSSSASRSPSPSAAASPSSSYPGGWASALAQAAFAPWSAAATNAAAAASPARAPLPAASLTLTAAGWNAAAGAAAAAHAALRARLAAAAAPWLLSPPPSLNLSAALLPPSRALPAALVAQIAAGAQRPSLAALAVSPLVLSPLPPSTMLAGDDDDDEPSAPSSRSPTPASWSPPPSNSGGGNGGGGGWPSLRPAAGLLSSAWGGSSPSLSAPSSRIPAFRRGAATASAAAVGAPAPEAAAGASGAWHTARSAVITVESFTRPSITPPIPLNQLLKGQASRQTEEMLAGLIAAAAEHHEKQQQAASA
jgi:hypothetical protein